MQINLSEDRANKIKTSKSIRISLFEEERIAQMGMSVTAALRMGLDMVLLGMEPGVSSPSSPSKAVVKGSSLDDNPIWEKHVGYLDTSEDVSEFHNNWLDFTREMEERGREVTSEMLAYCNPILDRFGVERFKV